MKTEHFGQSLPKTRFLGLPGMFSPLPFCWDLGKGGGEWESSFVLLSSLLFYGSFVLILATSEENNTFYLSRPLANWIVQLLLLLLQTKRVELIQGKKVFRRDIQNFTFNYNRKWRFPVFNRVFNISSLTLDQVWGQTAPDRTKLRASVFFTPKNDQVLWKD